MVQIPCGPNAFFYASADYFAVGDEDDFVRMPLGGLLAQRLADIKGCHLPTKRMVDLIWKQARVSGVTTPAKPWGPPYDASMYSMGRIAAHNDRIQAGLDGVPWKGALIAGHKKDVVVSNLLTKGRLAIYGWQRADGTPIQGPKPNATTHEETYSDYSHGIRLIGPTMRIDGKEVTLLSALSHPDWHKLVSDEGELKVLVYPCTRVAGPAPGSSVPVVPPSVKLGSTGEAVKQWQRIIGVTVTGVFDQTTDAKTRLWQKANGLTDDGWVGEKTWKKALAGGSIPPPPPGTTGKLPFVQAKNYRQGRRNPLTGKACGVDLIILHTMENPEKPDGAENVAAWFAGKYAPQASAHYCLDCDSVVQCVKDSDTAWAAPGANHNGIQLEHAGRANQTSEQWSDAYSEAMLRLSANLVAELCRTHNVPLQWVSSAGLKNGERGLTTHVSVSEAFRKSDHTDPGPNFPFDRYLEMVKEAYG